MSEIDEQDPAQYQLLWGLQVVAEAEVIKADGSKEDDE